MWSLIYVVRLTGAFIAWMLELCQAWRVSMYTCISELLSREICHTASRTRGLYNDIKWHLRNATSTFITVCFENLVIILETRVPFLIKWAVCCCYFCWSKPTNINLHKFWRQLQVSGHQSSSLRLSSYVITDSWQRRSHVKPYYDYLYITSHYLHFYYAQYYILSFSFDIGNKLRMITHMSSFLYVMSD